MRDREAGASENVGQVTQRGRIGFLSGPELLIESPQQVTPRAREARVHPY